MIAASPSRFALQRAPLGQLKGRLSVFGQGTRAFRYSLMADEKALQKARTPRESMSIYNT